MGNPKLVLVSKETMDREVNRANQQRENAKRILEKVTKQLAEARIQIASLEAGWRSAKAELDQSKAEHESTKSELQKLIKRVGKANAVGIARG